MRRLFGVDVIAADGEAPTWDPSVRFFRMVNTSTSAPIAAFYLDAYSAPRKRRSGFWADAAVGYSKLLGVHGTPRRPVAYIVGDVALPEQEGATALLTFRQVRGLFRAMGQALQEMLSQQDEGLAAGTKGVELDAVGFPSRFLELWAFDRATLRSMGGHFLTGEQPPDAMIDAVVASQSFHRGSHILEDVRWAQTDLELHARFDPDGDRTAFEVARDVHERTTVVPPCEEERKLCSFLGPFATGYAAGHYADLWADVLAADAFEAFDEAGINDDAVVQQLGSRFRTSVLAPGGGRSPLAAFRDFRGRIPRVAALRRRLGLTHGDAQHGAGGRGREQENSLADKTPVAPLVSAP